MIAKRPNIVLRLIFISASWLALLASGSTGQTRTGKALATLSVQLSHTHWVAYSPTNYNPGSHPPQLPTNDSIREDLRVLRRAGFDGLVTYGASLPQIVDIAQNTGFTAILLGVWDPTNKDELSIATHSAKSTIVLGLIVGNEGLMFKRYTIPALKYAMDFLRSTTGKPVSTTEIIESYYSKPELVEWSDFLAVNAHPFFHGRRNPPEDAVNWTLAAWKRLRDRVPRNKPILFKELGLPTAGQPGLSEQAQNDYYLKLRETDVQFVFFEAFDARFKHGQVEQSWGIFRADRSPKPAAAVLAKGTDQ